MKLDFITDAFDSIGDAIDKIFTSDEERGEIEVAKQKVSLELEQVKQKVYTEAIKLQSLSIEVNGKIAIEEQKSGSVISKNWRPLCSVGSFIMLSLMGFEIIEFNTFLASVYGSMIGYHGVLRSLVDKK